MREPQTQVVAFWEGGSFLNPHIIPNAHNLRQVLQQTQKQSQVNAFLECTRLQLWCCLFLSAPSNTLQSSFPSSLHSHQTNVLVSRIFSFTHVLKNRMAILLKIAQMILL
jgi:hypothetical protein